MILQREIAAIAQEKNVAKLTIDKDWVLGHFLDAIYSITDLKENLIFKGGTCIKKCYLPDYRFSEDLDFTCRMPDFQLEKAHITKISRLMDTRVGAPTHIEKFEALRHNNMPPGYQAIIKFWGADHKQSEAPPVPARWLTSVKIEVITYEQVLLPLETRKVLHDYSDKLTTAVDDIACYSVAEMMSEKLRALIQRSYSAPRDYYDIWMLTQRFPDLDNDLVVRTFHEKVKFKGLNFTGPDQLINPNTDRIISSAWNNSLSHQIPDGTLPEYGVVREALKALFERIF